MADFKVVLPTTTEEWQRDMNIAYNQALEDFSKTLKDDWSYKNSEISDRVIDRVKDNLKK